MSSESAICSFANSLIRHNKGFVLDGQRWKDDWNEVDELVVAGAIHRHTFDIVHGPPESDMVHAYAETGPRSLGDWDSWVIRRGTRGQYIAHR